MADARLELEIIDICEGIGRVNPEDGHFEKGEECLECIRDLQRAMRRDNPAVRRVFEMLCRWDIFRTHFVPLVLTEGKDFFLMFHLCKVMAAMLQDLADSSPGMDPKVRGRLESYLPSLKEAIATPQFAAHLLASAADSIERIAGQVAGDEDLMFVELVLDVLMNGLRLPERPGECRLQDLLIELYFDAGVFQIVQLFAREHAVMNDFQFKFLVYLLLIVRHAMGLYAPNEVARASLDKDSLETQRRGLAEMVRKEQHRKLPAMGRPGSAADNRGVSNIPLRHSHFGGQFVKLLKDANASKIVHKVQDIDNPAQEKTRKVFRRNMVQKHDTSETKKSSTGSLHILGRFATAFIESHAFMVMLESLTAMVDDGDGKLSRFEHLSMYFVCRWCSEFWRHRLMALSKDQQQQQQQQPAEGGSGNVAWDSSPLAPIFTKSLLKGGLDLVMRGLEPQMKDYEIVETVGWFLAELMTHSDKMVSLGDEKNRRAGDTVQLNLLDEREHVHFLSYVLAGFVPRQLSYAFLCAVVEASYYFLKHASRFARDGRIAVKRRAVRRKKQKKKNSSSSNKIEGADGVSRADQAQGETPVAAETATAPPDAAAAAAIETETAGKFSSEREDPLFTSVMDFLSLMEGQEPSMFMVKAYLEKTRLLEAAAGTCDDQQQEQQQEISMDRVERLVAAAKHAAVSKEADGIEGSDGEDIAFTIGGNSKEQDRSNNHSNNGHNHNTNHDNNNDNFGSGKDKDKEEKEGEEEDVDADDEDAMEEVRIDLNSLTERFATQRVLDSLLAVFGACTTNNPKTNHYVLSIFEKIVTDLNLAVAFMSIKFFSIAERLLRKERLDRWPAGREFCKKIVRLHWTEHVKNPRITLEGLFNWNVREHEFIASGYTKQSKAAAMRRRRAGGHGTDGMDAGTAADNVLLQEAAGYLSASDEEHEQDAVASIVRGKQDAMQASRVQHEDTRPLQRPQVHSDDDEDDEDSAWDSLRRRVYSEQQQQQQQHVAAVAEDDVEEAGDESSASEKLPAKRSRQMLGASQNKAETESPDDDNPFDRLMHTERLLLINDDDDDNNNNDNNNDNYSDDDMGAVGNVDDDNADHLLNAA